MAIRFKRYNVPSSSGGDAQATVVNNTGGGSSVVTVDLSDVYDRLNNLESGVNRNKDDIRTINNTLDTLDDTYINHGGDSDDGAYTFGQVISDDVRSPWFFSDGIGFRAYWDETGYQSIIKDIGISNISFTRQNGEATQLTNQGYTRVTIQKDNAIVLTNTIQGASVYFKAGINTLPAGATIIEEHCYASMFKSMEPNQQPTPQLAPAQPPVDDELIEPNTTAVTTTIYTKAAMDMAEVTGMNIDDIDVPISPETISGLWTELYKDGQEWVLRLDTSGHECTYSLRYEAIIYYSNQQLQTYVTPYITGSIDDSTTRFYGGSTKQTIATPQHITVIEDNNGMRITKDSILKTTDGGATWQVLLQ